MRDRQPPFDATVAAPETASAYDAGTLAELEDIFGRPRLMDLLAGLKAEISVRLQEPDRAALMRDAHALLSVSGSLGFSMLSIRCSEMERVCAEGGDTTLALSAARAAAESAIAAIRAMEAIA